MGNKFEVSDDFDRFTSWTGKRIDPLHMTEGDICIDDIAISLANQGRYAGHTSFHYSIAQHSVVLAKIVPFILAQRGQITEEREYRDYAAAALFHDAPEAYVQDQIVANKRRLFFKRTPYKTVELRIQRLIFNKYLLEEDYLDVVHEFDKRICENEKTALQPSFKSTGLLQPIPGFTVTKWTPEFAKQMFLTTCTQLEIGDEEEN